MRASLKTYLTALDDDRILIIKKTCRVFSVDGTDILFQIASNNHDLPLAAVFGDATEFRAAMAACLHEERLVFAVEEKLVVLVMRKIIEPICHFLLAIKHKLVLNIDPASCTCTIQWKVGIAD